MVKPPSLTGLMPKLATQGCRRGEGGECSTHEGRLLPEAERATLTLCCTHSNCTKVAASETNVRTNRHTHTATHTQAHTHSSRHTHRYTFYFIIPALSFILLYFLLFFSGFISTYFTLHFSLLPLLLFVFFAFGPLHLPPHKTKGDSCAGSANLCV